MLGEIVDRRFRQILPRVRAPAFNNWANVVQVFHSPSVILVLSTVVLDTFGVQVPLWQSAECTNVAENFFSAVDDSCIVNQQDRLWIVV